MGKSNIIKNKYYLFLTEFFAGMSVMAVELGASRLLAPYFSSSQIVWTIIIGTIMIAMALGNIWGGRSADKDPNPDKLYMRLIIAAVWIAAIPVVGKYIIIGVSALLVVTISNNLLIIAAFLACMIIFVFPLFLLGTVTPSLVKYTVNSLDDSGKVVGTLGAYNTIGSIIGTFLPTFVTIPAVGTAITFLIFSGILLIIGIIYFLNNGRKKKKVVIAFFVFLCCSIIGSSSSFAFWEKSLIYEGESIYNYLQVKENKDNVVLSTNVLFGVQSIMVKDGSLTGMYYDYALAAPLMSGIVDERGGDILILGMGTGTYAKQCHKYFNNVDIQGVEIDSKITTLSTEYFDMDKDIDTITYDGRAYLHATEKKYDVIMVDAYQDITIPFQMSTVEFFQMVKDHLKADGIMVVNMNMHTNEDGSINSYLADTISSVFGDVQTIDVPNCTNRELFAKANGNMKEALKNNINSVEDEDLQKLMIKVRDEISEYKAGNYIFTDDKAPVELLGMKVIDKIVQKEIKYYKDVFKKEGLKGILNIN
ncbi:Spermidine synthase [Hathewaya proteolytica DSM 3090]|uniref:Spermidine synthase n=1 Tax=Hathewaya proteolytica DSM 3090 TaxID=1121331 RepID=A0A1M6K2M1_9CLOT|nr:fused MFS/spermidine synthase [Hathewaya proteolytica]SHJ53144.1 Spermidine synthase [Hathewaya proteolytica DSM 3090]